jgi:hypothetical protein
VSERDLLVGSDKDGEDGEDGERCDENKGMKGMKDWVRVRGKAVVVVEKRC